MPSKLSGTLISTLATHLTLSKSRLETLAGLIILLVNVRTANLTHIAATFHHSQSRFQLLLLLAIITLSMVWSYACTRSGRWAILRIFSHLPINDQR